jgi:hypothetical protein
MTLIFSPLVQLAKVSAMFAASAVYDAGVALPGAKTVTVSAVEDGQVSVTLELGV